MNLIFILLCYIHCFIWLFVLVAFLNKQAAHLNLYYVIPLIYLLHILPFHILTTLESLMYDDYNKKMNDLLSWTQIHSWFINCQKHLEKFCTFSPISAQGMLIFGALTSAYALNMKMFLSSYGVK